LKAPHVGHLYTLVLTDIFKRWATLQGYYRPVLLTGTDEHGMKIQRAAQKARIDTKLFCDETMNQFDQLARKANISYDRFIRTTDPDHKEAVQHFWQELNHRGYIYESAHDGWYSISDETFFPQSAVHLIRDPATGRKMMVSIETGREVEWTSETNYHFRLSAFRDRLLEHYEKNPEFVVPASRMNHVIQEVKTSLEDLSISRPAERLTWGIPVPNDASQTIYVWLDALVNYLTQAGYPFAKGQGKGTEWPPDVQVIGKDIMKFHCVYWPAFLMALNLPLPRQVLTHAHWTMNHAKMSKSAGNVVNPFFAIDRFEVDTMRFYMAHDGGIADDSDYENAFIIERYKKSLQGGIGNLVSRIMRGKRWNVPECIKFGGGEDLEAEPLGKEHRTRLVKLPAQVKHHFKALNPRGALHNIMSVLHEVSPADVALSDPLILTRFKTNRFITHNEVWRRVNDPIEKTQRDVKIIIYYAAESMRICGILLQPFMPSKMKQMLDMVGVDERRRLYQHAGFGADLNYGVPLCDLGKTPDTSLFPPLTSEW
jgi:methionyl-tRNA synthetase